MADSVFIWAAFRGFFFRIVTVSQSSDIVLANLLFIPSVKTLFGRTFFRICAARQALYPRRSFAALIVKKILNFRKMVQHALKVLSDDPDRVKPFLTEVYPTAIGVIMGFSGFCFFNAVTRRPLLSGLFSNRKQSTLCKQFIAICRNPATLYCCCLRRLYGKDHWWMARPAYGRERRHLKILRWNTSRRLPWSRYVVIW